MKQQIQLLLAVFVSLLSSCKEDGVLGNRKSKIPQEWTEAKKWKYFQDSIAHRNCNFSDCSGLNNFYNFSNAMLGHVKAKNIHNPFIYAFEEPYIDTTQIDTSKSWFRIVVMPCFRKPYCLTIEKKNSRTFLSAKLTNGDGGYFPGLLDISTTSTYSDTIYNDLLGDLKNLNFWELGVDSSNRRGIDGETWCFEAIDKGRYNCIYRWVPYRYGNAKTKKLAEIGSYFLLGSNLLDLYSFKYEIDLERLEDDYLK